MLKKLLLSLFLLFVASAAVLGQATIKGKATEEGTNEPVIANLKLFRNNVYLTGVASDFDGNYVFNNVDPGTYDIEATAVGFQPQRINGVLVKGSSVLTLDFAVSKGVLITEVVVRYKPPVIDQGTTQQGRTITSDEIKNMPIRDVNGIAAQTAGVTVGLDGGTPTIKGSRPNSTDYYIDGIRVRGSSTVPTTEIEQLEVITGGLAAQYGDVTGGIISITTKGPASKFSGNIEAETSRGLDPYQQSLGILSLSGPIWQRKSKKVGVEIKESVIGFRVSGQIIDQKDSDPPSTPIIRAKAETVKALQENPLVYRNGTYYAAAEYLTPKDFEVLNYRPNNTFKKQDLTAKLDFKLSKAVDLTMSGTYYGIQDQIAPSGNASPNGSSSTTWRLFNSDNNPINNSQRMRFNMRLRHRLGGSDNDTSRRRGFVIENASYALQLGYEPNSSSISDVQHGDRLFNYGYVGQFNRNFNPVFGISLNDTTLRLQQLGYNDVAAGYKAGTINPVYANYNKLQADVANLGFGVANAYNGAITSQLDNVFNIHGNVGQVYNNYTKSDGNLITGSVNFNFDLLPNGSREQAHKIQFGLLYEQRVDRSYTVRPFNLWGLAYALQNNKATIDGIDTTNVLRNWNNTGDSIYTLAGLTSKVYAPGVPADISKEIQFYKSIRDKFYNGKLNTYVNVDALNPSDLTLDMFSAKELNDQNLLDYYGYDYLGRAVGTNTTFDDFFKVKDARGARTFPVAPLAPIYMAGYIQDKFTFKDLIFNIGIRVDRYDGNTKVLKDPYSLYDIANAKDYYSRRSVTKPANIGDDYKIYTTRDNPTDRVSITGYRNGDQWYDKNGTPTQPILIFGEGGIAYPSYKLDTFSPIKQTGFDTKNAFEDYKPQINIMPRLSFSFPISTQANFFAHYDVLTSRPVSNTQASALDYYYFQDIGRNTDNLINNPNLKPETTIDYEAGFQQELTKTSSIKIAAYYKELRNLIQTRFFEYVPGATVGSTFRYRTYDNVDFGTVKGFTFQYDLRRTGIFSSNINYTLQFADGTGSDADAQAALANKGNIRTLSPLNYDERHRIAATFDFRYLPFEKYTGPRIGNFDVLANTGLSFQVLTVSGRPYTPRTTPAQFSSQQLAGGINSARLPWTFNVDMRIDRTFSLSKDRKRPLDLNVFFRVQNLLDIQNIRSIYTASGSPDNDGYLSSYLGRQRLDAFDRPELLAQYVYSYNARMVNPDFYYQPRRMYIGFSFGF
jgi:hypothetical protein